MELEYPPKMMQLYKNSFVAKLFVINKKIWRQLYSVLEIGKKSFVYWNYTDYF